MTRSAVVAACALVWLCSPASAVDFAVEADTPSAGSSLGLSAGFGYTWIEANELVYYPGHGARASQLIWETQAPVVAFGADGVFLRHWTIDANLALGFGGSSYMEDYDWVEPLNPSFADDDWTDRSIHPDTRLQRYVNLDVAIGRDLTLSETTTVNLHGGFKYINYKASAYGGSYVYSDGAFRNDVGEFPAGLQVISYEQRMPGLFLGGKATVESGNWTLSGLVRGGVMINASDIDYHFGTGTRFDGDVDPMPFVSLGARADYRLTDRLSFFIGGDFDKVFRTKSDVTLSDIATGVREPRPASNRQGMDFLSATATAGVKLKF